MTMIHKIAWTAAMMLFLLAQFISGYVIFASHQEKIELLQEKEGRYFVDAAGRCMEEIQKSHSEDKSQEYVMTYFFREYMPEDVAFYKDGKELYNGSRYVFEIPDAGWQKWEYPCRSKLEQINGRYLLVFYLEKDMLEISAQTQKYSFFYVQDITSVYLESFSLVIKEAFFSLLASVGMAALLVYRIKKITKPLQAVNETQRQLIGSMSHELKTPLTAIQGYSETLLAVKLSKEQEDKALHYIHKESARLSRLSEKMMELTELYDPDCKIVMEDVLVEDLFLAVANSVRHSLKEKEIVLEREGEFLGKKKRMDADLMTSFLINLINNAKMASETGSRIFLGADAKSLWVRDTGCGIAPDELEKVKKAFYRVDQSRSRKSGNMGLGLALCDQIAAAHGGQMKMESKVKAGTKVWVEIEDV
ncbi:MAG: HAMP domain-containing histidine kinase [Eubacterium sp.]|nr:HAMP domain-containing histidine kinase [Eubacterium sp.]